MIEPRVGKYGIRSGLKLHRAYFGLGVRPAAVIPVLPVAVIQGKADNTATGTSRVVTPAAVPTAGSYQIIFITVNSGTTSRVTSITQTNCVWAKIAEILNTGVMMECWACFAGNSPGSTLTINYAASVAQSTVYYEVQGIKTTSPVRQFVTFADADVLTIPSGNAVAGDFCIGAAGVSAAVNVTAVNGGYTLGVQTTAGSPETVVGYKIAGSTGATSGAFSHGLFASGTVTMQIILRAAAG